MTEQYGTDDKTLLAALTADRVVSDLETMIKLVKHGWTRYHRAVDLAGMPTDPRGPDAERFCMHGAFVAARGEDDSPATLLMHAPTQCLLNQLANERGCKNYVEFNDQKARTQEDVVDLLTVAIRRAKRSAKAKWGRFHTARLAGALP